MEAIHSRKNQYRGINAHYTSYLLHVRNWASFHTSHLVYIAQMLGEQLSPLGYDADIEQSIQIRVSDQESHRPESDVTIYDLDPDRAGKPSIRSTSLLPSTVVLPLAQTIPLLDAEDYYYKAVVIYKNEKQGKPVAWIELLSPSNNYEAVYGQKRSDLLRSGIVFVEIDYLHTLPPTIRNLKRYRGKQTAPDAHPYRILVFEPRPSFNEGQVYVQEFDVDEPIPITMIPLSDTDHFEFELNQVYQKTFEAMGYGKKVDYTQLPANFDQYSDADQLRVIQRMLTVIQAKQAGQDLEAAAPLPIAESEMTLQEAMDNLKIVLP